VKALAPLLLVATFGCGGLPPEAARAQARAIWQDRCTLCHGAAGHGDGINARNLLVPPRTLSDPAWQAKVDDDHLAKVILEGGAAVGLDPAKPPNLDLAERPEVLRALVEHVRGL
jgi:hypothetical protein